MFLEHVKSFLGLVRSDLPWPLRRKVELAATRLAIIKVATKIGLLPSKLLPNPMNVVGFLVSYFRLNQLNYLFREIFVDAQYLFQADNDRPFIIDCGSNIGMAILFFKSLYPQARIMDSNQIQRLLKN